jgi:hypothetical protein
MLGIAVGCLLVPLAATQWAKFRRPPAPPFAFPTAELAALDRDLQARFAVVPEKDFGIERTYGNQHYLYNPNTPAERATINALKKQKTEAAFYLMSRALWLRSWDGWGYKPIQGPVVLTGKITAPLPRKINFAPQNLSSKEAILDQENTLNAQPDQDKGLPTHNPDGTPVPSPTPPKVPPDYNELQAIGNQVFELAENAPRDAKIGLVTRMKNWRVVAVPIRASQKECLPCHVYRPLGKDNDPDKLKVEVGDALGVAFYAYRPAKAK